MAAMLGPGGPSVAATLGPGGPIMGGTHRWITVRTPSYFANYVRSMF